MDDSVGVQVFQSHDNLMNIILSLEFCQSFPPFHQLIQSLMSANLQQNVNIVMIFKHMFELSDVRMLDAPVDLYFTD